MTFSKKGLFKISLKRSFAMDKDVAWHRMSNLSVAHLYMPYVVHSELFTTRKRGVGVGRRLYYSRNKWVEETVMEWKEGQGFLLHRHLGEKGGAPFPFVKQWFRYTLISDSRKGRCQCEVTLYYQPRGSILSPLMAFLLRPFLVSNLRSLLRGMKICYEIKYSRIKPPVKP